MNEWFVESCEVFRDRTYDPPGHSTVGIMHPAHRHLCCYFLLYLKISLNLEVVKQSFTLLNGTRHETGFQQGWFQRLPCLL